jgi:hypothetical protein
MGGLSLTATFVEMHHACLHLIGCRQMEVELTPTSMRLAVLESTLRRNLSHKGGKDSKERNYNQEVGSRISWLFVSEVPKFEARLSRYSAGTMHVLTLLVFAWGGAVLSRSGTRINTLNIGIADNWRGN